MKENLLLKIIPKHLLDAMKKLVYQKLMEIDSGPTKIFHDMLVERHDGVRSRRIMLSFDARACTLQSINVTNFSVALVTRMSEAKSTTN